MSANADFEILSDKSVPTDSTMRLLFAELVVKVFVQNILQNLLGEFFLDWRPSKTEANRTIVGT